MSCDELRSRVLAGVRAEPSPTRAHRRWQSAAVLAACAAIMIALFLALGGVRAGGPQDADLILTRPTQLMLLTWLGAVALAGIAAWALFHRGPSMLGRRRIWLASFSLGVVGALVAWKFVASSQFADMTLSWPARPGLRCLGLSLLLGSWPLAALSLLRRRSDPLHPRATGAAIGVVAGVTAWLLVDLWCPVAYFPHLLLGHVLPIALFGLAGAYALSRWIAVARG